jgi:ribosome-binding protein aMBF1 (putative translation factor)
MMGKNIQDKHIEMMQDSKYRKEFESQEKEFTIARELIKARLRAGLTQQQLAERMETKQSVIARMEAGRPLPSFRSLEKYAKATQSKIKLSLEAIQ